MLEHFIERLTEILSTFWGWLMLVGMVVLDYISGYCVMVNITVMSVVLDAVWGIVSSVKQGRFALSELARNTLSKLAVYGSALICFIGVDRLLGIGDGLTTSIICACIVLVELWSSCASMIICFPQMPFLCLLKRALIGEIARKLGIEPEEVEDVLQQTYKTDGKKH